MNSRGATSLMRAESPRRASTSRVRSFSTIEIACSKGARSWQLRAAISLAQLLGRHGRSEEARGPLGEIYASFTEGFETGDLREAKALLDRP